MFYHPMTDLGYNTFEEDIRMMQIIQEEDINTTDLVDSSTTLKQCMDHMTETKTSIVVTNFEGVPGIYTMGDFKRFLVENAYDLRKHLDKPISDFANFDAVKISIGSSYSDAKDCFEKFKVNHLVVVDDNFAIGGLHKSCLA